MLVRQFWTRLGSRLRVGRDLPKDEERFVSPKSTWGLFLCRGPIWNGILVLGCRQAADTELIMQIAPRSVLRHSCLGAQLMIQFPSKDMIRS